MWIEDLKKPKVPYSEVYKDFWFACDHDGNPIYVLMPGDDNYPHFQANSTKAIVEGLGPKIPIFDHVVQIPYAYIPHKCDRY